MSVSSAGDQTYNYSDRPSISADGRYVAFGPHASNLVMGAIHRQSRLCEPPDPVNGNWTCLDPRDTQLQVDLEPGEIKKILV